MELSSGGLAGRNRYIEQSGYNMQQRKHKNARAEARQSNGNSHFGPKMSTLGYRSSDSRSKLGWRDSELRDGRKSKVKINGMSMISSTGIEEQFKKEVALSAQLIKECEKVKEERHLGRSEKQEIMLVEDTIKEKDRVIARLMEEIKKIKESDRHNIPEEDNSNSQKPKWAQEDSKDERDKVLLMGNRMRKDREELAKAQGQYLGLYQHFDQVRRQIEHLQDASQKQANTVLLSFEEFKERQRERRKVEGGTTVRKGQFTTHNPDKTPHSASKNMRDLLNRKKVTIDAIKNSKKKRQVLMSELQAKLQFLQDQDAHLAEQIKAKDQQLQRMEFKFQHNKVQKQRVKQLMLHQ